MKFLRLLLICWQVELKAHSQLVLVDWDVSVCLLCFFWLVDSHAVLVWYGRSTNKVKVCEASALAGLCFLESHQLTILSNDIPFKETDLAPVLVEVLIQVVVFILAQPKVEGLLLHQIGSIYILLCGCSTDKQEENLNVLKAVHDG